ncbi:macrophage mannose receptor 1-like [Macrobrachium nipponense]|uniref:macrophage mannose receptor 1-like n=1 Tax=Macrobrachium nipponense TaxID=159736 RepID=UPI0030C86B98
MRHTRCFILLLCAVQLLLPCSAGTSDWEMQMGLPELTCPAFFQQVGDQCLFFSFMGPSNFKSAKQFCVGLQASLVIINSATQFENILIYIRTHGYESSSFWVDGSNVKNETVWVDSNKDLVVMNTPFWLASETVHKPSTEDATNCIALEDQYGFFMNNVDCEGLHSALCEYPLPTGVEESVDEENASVECPPFFVDVGGTCLAFVIWENVAWEDANIPCIGMEGELAILNNIQQLRDIYEYLHKHEIHQHSFWIGGSDKEAEGLWVWNDDTNITMDSPWWGYSSDGDKWVPEPTGAEGENCLALTSEGEHYLRDKVCSELFSPLCMISTKYL